MNGFSWCTVAPVIHKARGIIKDRGFFSMEGNEELKNRLDEKEPIKKESKR